MLTLSTLLLSVVLQAAPAGQRRGPVSAARQDIAEAIEALDRKESVRALAAADHAVAGVRSTK